MGLGFPDPPHIDEIPQDSALSKVVDLAAQVAGIGKGEFNVLKVGLSTAKVSLLDYPQFHEVAFPVLTRGWSVDLKSETVRCRQYNPAGNAPILHRKELLLSPDHPSYHVYRSTTLLAEKVGLFDHPMEIGFRHAWNDLLRASGFWVEGNSLVETEADVHAAERWRAKRHRTAISRHNLSSPMQHLWRHGFLDGAFDIFDYGCGKGDDIQILSENGLAATGWDPHFAPEFDKREADIVNLGFVLNVIEDPEERREALVGAAKLARKLLVVAVMIGGRSAMQKHRLYRDGVLTSRDTFQKYFTQNELRQYIRSILSIVPIPVAPGVYFVFTDDRSEQEYLVRRESSFVPSTRLIETRQRTTRSTRHRRKASRKPNRYEYHSELAKSFWESCLRLGRIPEATEFSPLSDVIQKLGRPKTVLSHLVRENGPEQLEQSRQRRRSDLLVYLSMNMFEGRKSFGHLPDSIQKDIKTFVGAYSAALGMAKDLLFSAGRREVVQKHAQESVQRGLAWPDGDHSILFHSSVMKQLPAVLRVVVGCAEKIYGEIETADLVKIHLKSAKISVMNYDDFEGKSLPILLERVKIDLARQEVYFFDYSDELKRQVLFFKSRYLSNEHPMYEQQRKFDREIEALRFLDFSDYGPHLDAFRQLLSANGYRVVGYSIQHTTPAGDLHPEPKNRSRL